MSKIAFDIVLLPPEDVMDIAIGLCRKFPDGTDRLPLNKENNFPHNSLLMGITEKSNLKDIYEKVREVAKDFKPFELSIREITYKARPDGTEGYFLKITKTPELQNLHERLVNGLTEYHPYDATMDMFYRDPDEKLNEVSMFWLENYVKKHSLENYNPHITLKGCKNPQYEGFPINFTTNRLAVCHLGNYCTCRKILWETKFQPSAQFKRNFGVS